MTYNVFGGTLNPTLLYSLVVAGEDEYVWYWLILHTLQVIGCGEWRWICIVWCDVHCLTWEPACQSIHWRVIYTASIVLWQGLLHLWVMIVLLTYQPEIHGNMAVPHETQWCISRSHSSQLMWSVTAQLHWESASLSPLWVITCYLLCHCLVTEARSLIQAVPFNIKPELTGDRFPLPVNTGRVDGNPVSTSRVDGLCWRVVETRAVNAGSGNWSLLGLCKKPLYTTHGVWYQVWRWRLW